MLSFEQARDVVAEKIQTCVGKTETETVPVGEGLGRVLAAPAVADRDYPPFNRSTRDGYAVRAADVEQTPARLKVVGETRAGEPSRFSVGPGEAVEIMTGAPGPEGADAVVMLEDCRREDGIVIVEQGVASGKNLIFRGAEAGGGAVVLEAGTPLDYPQIALLASVGYAEIQVYCKPRVAILSTGDEVAGVEAEPETFQIRNSNAYSLAAQVQRAGGEPVILPVAPDERERTRELIEQGLQADLLLLSGGVSMGKYDLVEQVLEELGAEFFFTRVAIQPGKPLVFGCVRDRPLFGLPGNPVSTMVTFEIFAKVALHHIAGRCGSPLRFLQARLGSPFRHKPKLTRFLPAKLTGCYGDARVDQVKWQGSGDLAATAQANCFLVATPDRASWEAGELISVLPL